MLEFMYNEMPVGLFQEEALPTERGSYHYMPYRGPGHYEMQTALHLLGRAACYYRDGSREVTFVVTGCPEKGVLELADFRLISNPSEGAKPST